MNKCHNVFAAQARHKALRAFTDVWRVLDPDPFIFRGKSTDDEEAWNHA